jgi:hypothetical protein
MSNAERPARSHKAPQRYTPDTSKKGKKGGGTGVGKGITKKTAGTTKRRVSKKKKKVAGPKRGKSAYLYFTLAKRPEVQKDHPGAKLGAISKILGQMWKELTEDDKKPYQALAEKDKERYEREKKTLINTTSTSKSESEEEESEDKASSEKASEGKDTGAGAGVAGSEGGDEEESEDDQND